MSSWNTQIRKLGGCASAAAIALVLSSGIAWAEDVPGDLWSVSYVKVNGADKDAVRRGLQSAADRYFYGDEVEAVLQADVSEGGTFDLSIIGPGGKLLGRRNGLSYDPSGNVARSVSDAALGWMGNLGCAEGCAVAKSNAAPAPVQQVDVAEAAAAAVERAVAEAPKPDLEVKPVEVATPDAPSQLVEAAKPVEVAGTPIAVVEPPKVAKPVVAEPKPPVKSPEVKVATKPVEVKKPRKPIAEVARPKVAEAPKPDASATSKPSVTAPVATPTIPKARTLEAPNVAAAPSAGASSSAPTTAEVTPNAPVVAAKPEATRVPEVSIAQPSIETPTEPIVATAAETAKPEISTATPSVSVEATTPSVDTSEAPVETAEVQEVSPGITLPAPTEGSTPSTVAEIAAGASAAVSAVTPSAPTVSAVVTPSPAPETSTEAEAPSVAEVEPPAPSDDGDVEQLALVNPRREVTPLPTATPEPALAPTPTESEITTPAEAAKPAETETTATVETRIAAVDPTAEGPTLANARWVGFTPAVFTGSDNKAGAWISGPFDRKQRTGWITDTATGATTRVTFIWREGGSGSRTALLSREAAKALGLGQGDVANVAVYLPR